MPFLGAKPQLLSNCTSCLARQVVLSPASRAQFLAVGLRFATTAAKPRSKASAAATPEIATVPKKRLSTKTATIAAPAKTPRKKKAEVADDALASETAAPVVKKTRRPASTKTTAKKKTEPVAEEVDVKPKRTRKTTATAGSTQAAAAAPRFVKASEVPKANEPAGQPAEQDNPRTIWEVPEAIADSMIEEAQGQKTFEKEPEADRPRKTDPSSPEYKQASRRYVSVMVALPIFLVTSYFLFDRCTFPMPLYSAYVVAKLTCQQWHWDMRPSLWRTTGSRP